MAQLKRVLSVRDVALFNVTVVFGVRSLATAAKMGPLAITLWLVAILCFFVPHALSIMELGSRDPGEGVVRADEIAPLVPDAARRQPQGPAGGDALRQPRLLTASDLAALKFEAEAPASGPEVAIAEASSGAGVP